MGDETTTKVPVPLVLKPEDCADGLTHLDRTLDGKSFAYVKLSLTDRQLTSLGDGSKKHEANGANALESFKHIRYIDLARNFLQDPRCLAYLPSLLSINLSNNNIVTTCDMRMCKFLQVLNLSHNKLETFQPHELPPPVPLPTELERYRRLAKKEARQRRQNGEPSLKDEELLQLVITRDMEQKRQKAEEAAASDPETQELWTKWTSLIDPETGFQAPNLVHLIANYNRLKTLEHLDGLPSLLRLEAQANKLTSTFSLSQQRLPESLHSLRELILPDNPIQDLSGLHSLPNLQLLNLERCQISSLRPLLTGKRNPKKKSLEDEDDGEDGSNNDENEEESKEQEKLQEEEEEEEEDTEHTAAPEPEQVAGDGIHFGRWADEEYGNWIRETPEEIVEELGLQSDDDEEDDLDEITNKKQKDEIQSHPLSQLRVITLRGNPIEDMKEINRLRYLRGLISVDFRDTPIVEETGEDDFVTEVQIRLGGHVGQRIRVADPHSSHKNTQSNTLNKDSSDAVLERINGRILSAEDIDNARTERTERIINWRNDWTRREQERMEAERERRHQEEEERQAEEEEEDED